MTPETIRAFMATRDLCEDTETWYRIGDAALILLSACGRKGSEEFWDKNPDTHALFLRACMATGTPLGETTVKVLSLFRD